MYRPRASVTPQLRFTFMRSDVLLYESVCNTYDQALYYCAVWYAAEQRYEVRNMCTLLRHELDRAEKTLFALFCGRHFDISYLFHSYFHYLLFSDYFFTLFLCTRARVASAGKSVRTMYY